MWEAAVWLIQGCVRVKEKQLLSGEIPCGNHPWVESTWQALSSDQEITSAELDCHDYSGRKSQLSSKLEPTNTWSFKILHSYVFRIGQSSPSFFFFPLILKHFLPAVWIPHVGCHKPNTNSLSQASPEDSMDAETTNWSHKEENYNNVCILRENDRHFCIPWHWRLL